MASPYRGADSGDVPTPKPKILTSSHSVSGSLNQVGSNSKQPSSIGSPVLSANTDPLSPDATDRVFPIRSVVAVDTTRQAPGRSESPLGSERSFGFIPPPDPTTVLSSDAGSVRSARESIASILSAGQAPLPAQNAGAEEGFLTQRFSYQHTSDGHMVVTGIAGAETLQRCEDEPIHCPGAVQGFGALIVLKQDPKDDSKLVVRIASENTGTIVGYSPRTLFGLPSFTRILSDEQAENLLDHIDFTREGADDLAQNGPEVFSLIVTGRDALQIKLWCAAHIATHDPSLIICEFELEDDQIFPIAAADDERPPPAENTLDSDPTEEELLESTTSLSKPLRVLRHARRRRGEAAAMEVFNILSQIQEQLASAPDLTKFLRVLVGVVKELTGFHRVMIYQFDEAWNGKVVSELVDYRATKDLYKGLNFPASDIPKQARELYRLNKVRLLYDRDQVTARLVCRTAEDLEVPLDMTHTYLRAMSPIHIKYLSNMAVRASMSISITAFNELWGLISCHTYGNRGMRVAFPIRKLCRLIGETASRNIERLSYASRLQARKLINTVPTEANPSGYIVASSDDLLKLFDADFGLLSIRDETKVLGHLEDTQEALALVEYFRIKSFTSVITSQQLLSTFPDLKYPPGFKTIAGALLVPLSGAGKDFIVFFRKGQLRHVHWAGNPYEKTLKAGTSGLLEPRKSFKIWSETIVGKSKEWTDDEVETAAVLCLVYGKFIEVWRQKEAALQTSQLTRILLANASHEVRTPLNAIINYLEIALEGPLDTETRENLSRSHSASKSLIYVINDLLDLTRTEEGHNLIKFEVFDLSSTVREATDAFKSDAARKGIDFEVVEYPGLPQFIKGDQSKLRQAVANLAANAISHTTTGGVKVELWLSSIVENRCDIEIAVQDTGVGMSPKKLDKLFRELEQVQSDMDYEDSGSDLLSPGPATSTESQLEKENILGLGLAIVARIIRNMNGQLRLKSEEGKGSRFSIQMPFTIPDAAPIAPGDNRSPISSPAGPRTPHLENDPSERTLVRKDRSRSRPASAAMPAVMRRHSDDSMHSSNSMNSFRSGNSNKSEVDRLLESFSGSPLAQTPIAEEKRSLSGPSRSGRLSAGSAKELSPPPNTVLASTITKPGLEPVTDTKTPLKAVRIDEGDSQLDIGDTQPDVKAATESAPVCPQRGTSQPSASGNTYETQRQNGEDLDQKEFHVLVAEDDLVNSRIIKKRLEKLGHRVTLTVNGEECAAVFAERGTDFDAVLMDIQMPIMDGYASTKTIRKSETEGNSDALPDTHKLNGRIPIVAVSASLLEKERQMYIDCGFDGWILKPVDFKRLNILMDGIVNPETRLTCLYTPGQWERGGWFGGCPSS
ncbi:Light-sensor Protein kinase [Orbilia oligospora]|nr:Light-sensor Protein kinase [Orbilia oligospora]KAF3243501.1 Light-sensor Protein kinase [Orbilia oligospora]KAF3250194.1 Light-sensor Protein kinase [Orbilia oligospora]